MMLFLEIGMRREDRHPVDHPAEHPEFHADDRQGDPDLLPGGVVMRRVVPLEGDDGDVQAVQDHPERREERRDLHEPHVARFRRRRRGRSGPPEPDDLQQVPVPHRGEEYPQLVAVDQVDDLQEHVGAHHARGPLGEAEEDLVVLLLVPGLDPVLEDPVGEDALDGDHGEARRTCSRRRTGPGCCSNTTADGPWRAPSGTARPGPTGAASTASSPKMTGAGEHLLDDPPRLGPVQPLRDGGRSLQELAEGVQEEVPCDQEEHRARTRSRSR